jgi:hypothetical protein
MYMVRRWWGASESALPAERFGEVLAELDSADEEHPDVSLKHESEWALIYGRGRTLIFQNVEERKAKPRHLKDVAVATVIEFWKHLADGDLEWLEGQPWLPGYGS